MKQKIKLKKQHKKLVQEFGEFINRGNVVDKKSSDNEKIIALLEKIEKKLK